MTGSESYLGLSAGYSLYRRRHGMQSHKPRDTRKEKNREMWTKLQKEALKNTSLIKCKDYKTRHMFTLEHSSMFSIYAFSYAVDLDFTIT